MSCVVLVAIFGKFHLLVFDEGSICLFQIVDLDIETVDVTL